jgi:cell wall-associated NlpC family hydrolase
VPGNGYPGISAAGSAAGAAAGGSTAGGANIGGMSIPSWQSDTKGLDETSQKLGRIVTDISRLDAAVTKLTNSLVKMGSAFSNAAQKGGAFSGGQQGDSKNSAAKFSGFAGGTVGGTLAFGALAEVGARGAGALNAAGVTAAAGGMGADIIARQTNTIFGGKGAANSVTAFNGMLNTGPKDLNSALAVMQANPMLYAGVGSAKQKQLQGFVNALQKANPAMTATAAMNAANSLASGPALTAFQRLGGRNGQMGQGLVNPKTGAINSTNRVFSEMLQTVMGGKQMTSQQMKNMSGNSEAATKDWTTITQNNNIPGMGLGLSPQMLTELRQFAAAGGTLGPADKSMQKSGAYATLRNQTAKTARGDTQYEKTMGVTNFATNINTDFQDLIRRMTQDLGPLAGVAAAAAILTKHFFSLGSLLGDAGLVYEGIKGIKKVFGGSKTTGVGGGTTGGSSSSNGGCVTLCEPIKVNCGCGETGAVKPKKKSVAPGGGQDHGFLQNARNAMVWLFGGAAKDIRGAAKDIIKDAPKGDVLYGMGDPTGSRTTQGMTPSLARGVSAMRAANPNITISSGHRTAQQQATLYALKGGRGVAQVGQSKHQSGQAADLGPRSQFGWIAKNAAKFGLARPAPRSEPWHVESMGDPAPITGSQVVSGAQGFLGTPYVWGGTSTKGVDCSGLVVLVYQKLGINLPRTSQQQASAGTAVTGGLASAQPGDLILYNEPGEGPNSHVAIYIGGGQQIAAPHTGTVVQVQPVDRGHLSCIRRIIKGGAGQAAVQAAQSMVGTPSTDQQNHHAAGKTTLANTFISQVNAGGAALAGMSSMGAMGGTSRVSGGSAANTAATGSATGSTAMVGGSVGNITTPTQFSKAVLSGLGIGSTMADVISLNAWQQQEGQWTVPAGSNPYYAMNMHDPLNTKLPEPGSVSLGGATNSYPSWAEGVAASVSTIRQSNMAPIQAALKANDNLAGFTKALESTPWASSSYGGKSFANPSGPYAVSGDPVFGMGDPVGGRGTGGPVNVYMTNQMVSFSQQEAQLMVQMVLAEIKAQTGLSSVSGS